MSLDTAIDYLRQGDWQSAHALVQDDSSTLGAWAHGIVHLLEGDTSNARYWYRRADRAFANDIDPTTEIAALAAAFERARK